MVGKMSHGRPCAARRCWGLPSPDLRPVDLRPPQPGGARLTSLTAVPVFARTRHYGRPYIKGAVFADCWRQALQKFSYKFPDGCTTICARQLGRMQGQIRRVPAPQGAIGWGQSTALLVAHTHAAALLILSCRRWCWCAAGLLNCTMCPTGKGRARQKANGDSSHT